MIVIADYGIGNTGSVKNALDFLGFEVKISRDSAVFASASHIILPGVGSFDSGMEKLNEYGLVEVLRYEVLENKKPFLGLCLGMQLLAETGDEGGGVSGLACLKGRTRKFEVDERQYKIPQVGWNEVTPKPEARLFKGIKMPIFYFVHSYHFVPEDKEAIAGESEYGEKFVAAVEKDNIFGFQFHPEKSQQAGLKALENFLTL